MSALGALTAWRRWRILTVVVALVSIPLVSLWVLVASIPLGVGRGDAVTSPTGRWAFRVDDHGFTDPWYAPVLMERHGLAARYWEAGARFSPDTTTTSTEVFQPPRWTSDEVVEVRSNRRVLTYRVTAPR